MKNQKKQLLQILSKNKEHIDFGTSEDKPSPNEVLVAEDLLDIKLPSDYVWFLNSFGGGEVYGDEISSIYADRDIPSGDVCFRTLLRRKEGCIETSDILVCDTDFGEIFVLNSVSANDEGEYPVDLIRGNERFQYADSFTEFLIKFIINRAPIM